MAEFSVVTGAFNYTGKYIAQRLLALGQPVKTLTRRPPVDLDKRLSVAPLDFGDRDGLANALRGAATLHNTYWVRFPRGRVTLEQPVAKTKRHFKRLSPLGLNLRWNPALASDELVKSLTPTLGLFNHLRRKSIAVG